MHKFTISNEMEKIIIEKWTRLCTSCHNNAYIFTYIQPNRVRNWIFFSFTFSSRSPKKKRRRRQQQIFVCSRNTLVWIFYGLQENDGTVNCVVRRSKLQTKEHFKRRNSIRPFDKWCVSVFFFLSIYRAL